MHKTFSNCIKSTINKVQYYDITLNHEFEIYKKYIIVINQIFVLFFRRKENVGLFDNLVVSGIILCLSQFQNDKKK